MGRWSVKAGESALPLVPTNPVAHACLTLPARGLNSCLCVLLLPQVGGVKGGHARGGHSADPDRAPPPPEVKFGEDNK